MSEKTTVYAVILNPDDGIGGFDWYYAQEDARERAAELKATLGEHQVLGLIDVRVDVPAADSADPEQEITDEIDAMLGDLEAWVADPVRMWDRTQETTTQKTIPTPDGQVITVIAHSDPSAFDRAVVKIIEDRADRTLTDAEVAAVVEEIEGAWDGFGAMLDEIMDNVGIEWAEF